MSTFVLNRNYELELPNSFVEVDREEMEYVDGGYFINCSKSWISYTVDISLCLFGAAKLAEGLGKLMVKMGRYELSVLISNIVMLTTLKIINDRMEKKMGVSGELQYGLPFALIFVLINFIIINFKINSLKKYAFITAILYTGLKVYLLREFNFQRHLINLQIYTMILVVIYLVLQFYVLNKVEKKKEKKQLLIEIKFGYVYGGLMMAFSIIINLFNINIYNNEIKNLVLMSIEFILVGIIYIVITFLGIKIYEKQISIEQKQ